MSAQSHLPEHVFDVAIIGAGPVGLAMAIELARLGFETLVIDRRPPPAADARLRPQLLVARAGDLANLDHLGVDIDDPQIVSLLATRCEADLSSGRTFTGRVQNHVPERVDVINLALQPPIALVPIGRLQQALLDRALHHGARVEYGCEVTRLRRHARYASMQCADGTSLRAALVVIATGAARSLASTLLRGQCEVAMPAQPVMAGLFATGGDAARWIRVELPVPGLPQLARATMLQTPEATQAATGLLVQLPGAPTEEELTRSFELAAREHGLAGVPFVVEPQIFETAVTTMARRTIAGDGRAPIAIAGDAAQTGHVFSGQTCFVNLALAIGLGSQLGQARVAIGERKVNDPALTRALRDYETQSMLGAAALMRASRRHYQAHRGGEWALAGVAQAEVWAGRAIRLGRPVVFFGLWLAMKNEPGGRVTP